MESGISGALCDPAALPKMESQSENNHGSVTSHVDITDKAIIDSWALVVPPEHVKPLAVVPVNQKTKRTEALQRRTRRPFSVTEVEALVSAVEELGTGRCGVLHLSPSCLLSSRISLTLDLNDVPLLQVA